MSISAEEFFKRVDTIVSTRIEDVREHINTAMENQIKITNIEIKKELQKLLDYKHTMDKAAVESSAILSGLSNTELEELITLSGASSLSKLRKESSGTFRQAGTAIQSLKEAIVSEQTFKEKGIEFLPEKSKKFRDYLNYVQLGHNNSAATKKLEGVVAELYILRSELLTADTKPQIISALDGIIKVNRLALIASTNVDKNQQNKLGPDASTANISKFFSKITTYASPVKTKIFESEYLRSFISLSQLKSTKKGETIGVKISLSVENAFDNYAKAIYSQKINELSSAMSLEIAALFGTSTTTRTKLIKTIQSNKIYKTTLSRLKQAEKNSIIDIERELVKTDITDIRSSPTLLEMVEELLIETLKTGNDKGKKTNKVIKKQASIKKSVSKKSFLQDQQQIDSTLKKLATDTITKIRNIPTVSRLRTIKGQFTSLVRLDLLMRAALPPVLLKNMKRPNLINRTSRFRDSIKLNSLTRSRDGTLVAFLSYMKYPYATFESDGKQGRKGYYPTRLINQSVREIASKLVTERLRVVVT